MEKEIEKFDFEKLERRVKNENDRKTIAKVFDARTVNTIHELAVKGHFDVLEHIVSTGKEAHVFMATDSAGNNRAVKIFKKETTDFKRMSDYIVDDNRFKHIRRDRRNLVYEWTRKEYKNLLVAAEAKLQTPLPLAHKENVIVMEFIGDKEPAPKLKEIKATKEEFKNYKEQVIEFVAKFYLQGLVHADLSEYNILVTEKLVFIDFAQAVLKSHPKAKEFFDRDIENLAKFFQKNGVETDYESFYGEIKEKKKKLEEFN